MLMRRHFQLMDMLLVDIVDGVFGPGERLPSESELAEQFGSSRGVVRETIRALEERGVVRDAAAAQHLRRRIEGPSARYSAFRR